MIETSQQRNDVPHFFGNVFLGEGFKPVYGANKIRGAPSSSTSSSLFTIDSILAPRPKPASPQRPTLLQHPPIPLGHLAATGGFGTGPANFLGMLKL